MSKENKLKNEEDLLRKAIRKEIKQTLKEDNVAVDLITWLTNKMGVAVEKRALKKLSKDKELNQAFDRLRDRIGHLSPENSPGLSKIRNS